MKTTTKVREKSEKPNKMSQNYTILTQKTPRCPYILLPLHHSNK